MKRLMALALALLFGMGAVGAEAAAPVDPRAQWGLDWLKSALDGRADEGAFTADVASAIGQQGGLSAVLGGLTQSVGAVVRYGDPVAVDRQGMCSVMVPIECERMALNGILTLDADGKIAGLFFQPATPPQDVPLPDGATEHELTIDAGTGYPLGGTLLIPANPDGKLPAALLVWGSGASDRDEVAGANKVFAQLAAGLAERGIASLRFDKRTHAYPDLWGQPDFSVRQEYVQDVLAAMALLKSDPRVDPERIYLIGHSEGGMLAPRLVAEGADVAGMVLMAGSARDLSDILHDQEMDAIRGLDAPDLIAQYDAWREEARAVYALTEAEALAHAPLYGGAFPAYYLYEIHQHDAIAIMKQLQTPALVLQGGNDWQVSVDADYALYVEALAGEPWAQMKLYDGLNHLFMPSSAASLTEAMVEYGQPGQIPSEVLDDIASFVTQ